MDAFADRPPSPPPSPRRMRAALAAATIVAAGILARAFAQQAPPDARPPQLPDLPNVRATFDDPARSFGGLQFSDLSKVDLALDGYDLVLQIEMQKPIVDGMLTTALVDFDCDGRRDDSELRLRSTVGSRFRPNAYAPRPGFPAPMDLARASWASPFDEKRGLDAPRIGMTNWDALAAPLVGGTRMRLRFPADFVLDRGARKATTPPAFRMWLTTTCSEHPVAFDYDALDAGRPVVVDGKLDDWSGGPFAEDASEELHAALAHLDIGSVWCEHGAESVFVRVDFRTPGFGTIRAGDGDVGVQDRLVVRLEPRGDAYMDAVEVTVPATTTTGRSGRAAWACGTSAVEVSIPRNPKQTRFRIVAWTDGERTDDLTGSWHPFPVEAGK